MYHRAANSPEEFAKLVGKARIADVGPIAALALKRTGEQAEARRLLEIALENAQEEQGSPEDQQVRVARIYAVQGKTEEAIGLLSSAVRRGWIPPYLPIHVDIALDPPLAELNKDPRFEVLRQQILDHLKKERAELGPVKLN
jgi:predicted negative regulator of RcsB-dependent stress response